MIEISQNPGVPVPLGGSSSSFLSDPTALFSGTAARFAPWAAFRAFRVCPTLPGAPWSLRRRSGFASDKGSQSPG